ncbi:MAG: anthranilate synthase component I family protein [Ginsengibacter sp.]
MKKIEINTTYKKLLADIYTPVGIYLRLRDRFRDTILLESTDFHSGDNSFSFIGINAIGGIEVTNKHELEMKLPGRNTERTAIRNGNIPELIWEYMNHFDIKSGDEVPTKYAQGLYGYTTYDAVQFFETLEFDRTGQQSERDIPLIRYRLYQYVIVINHFKDELFICENHIEGVPSEITILETIIKSKDVPLFPFQISGEEFANISDEAYLDLVKKGIKSCFRGDVFQIVLSRRFEQKFIGDDFNVYRALRNINPSPYLFYFDYGSYKLMGSSPESQVIVDNGKAIVHPIAGTFKRTGNDETDKLLAEELLTDKKENAEHVMLVDLARNDLSRVSDNVIVSEFGKIQFYSHVIHLVSEVTGQVDKGTNPFIILANTFPAGTLSGAPKFKAMQLINEYEKDPRGYYAGCIGFVGFNGSFNHAIMIRSILSKQNTLVYQAGAGVVAASKPESELQEVNNKLGALKKAIVSAQNI